MSKDKLIPKLRFPEFKDKGEWVEDTLVNLAKFRRGSFPQPYGLPEWYDDKNGMPFIQVFDVSDNFRLKSKTKSKISKLASEQSVFIPKETVIITIQGSIGRVAITQYDAYIDRTLLLFEKFYNEIDKTFFAYVLFMLFEIEKEKAPGGIIKTITKEVLSDFVIKIPKLLEQQKIASCLSSLDELIAAHSQKLELLKDHKKGLMQNLFPQEGETVPKWRFKEFDNDEEWEEKELNELGNLINGLTYSPEDVSNNGLLVLRSSNIQNGLIDLNDRVYVREDIKGANLTQLNDILVCVRNGSKNLIGKNAIIPNGIPLATHGAFMTVFRGQNPQFAYQLFQTDFYERQVKADLGATINSINGKNFLKYKFPVPNNPKEQQKIASCLSSLDALIKAQAEKIEQLKLHKKGLMQGLFPKIID